MTTRVEPPPQPRQLPSKIVNLLLHGAPVGARSTLARSKLPATLRPAAPISNPPGPFPERTLFLLQFPGQTLRHVVEPRRVKMMNRRLHMLDALPGGEPLLAHVPCPTRPPHSPATVLFVSVIPHRGPHPLPLHPHFNTPFDSALPAFLRTVLRTGTGPFRSMGFTG